MLLPSSARSLAPRLLLLALTAAVAAAADYTFITLAGATSIGSTDGPGRVARFYSPRAVAVDRDGNVYVADTVNDTIRKITPAGIVSTLAGSPGQATFGMTDAELAGIDGTGSAARFSNPEGIVVDAAGNVVVADKMISVIRKVTPAGAVTTIAGTARAGGSVDGDRASARLFIPGGLALDSLGNLYVAEWVNHVIRKVAPDGSVTTLAGLAEAPGWVDGTGSAARFFQPTYLAVDRADNIFVSDTVNCVIRKITPAGVVTTFAGVGGVRGNLDGPRESARFDYPMGLAIDLAGNMYVADNVGRTIRKITPDGTVTTLAGAAGPQGSTDGTGAAARFRAPRALAVDAAGVLYVADEGDNTIRRISPAGEVTTLAGLGYDYAVGSNDGTASAARFNSLASTAVSPTGDVIAADPFNATIRKISPAGTVTTLAGLAKSTGSADGTGSTARFLIPSGVAVDRNGITFVADSGNHTIRRITAAGAVTTLAGTAGTFGSADGSGSAAAFFYPYAIAVAADGTLYVSDLRNYAIRKINSTGTVTTLAGAAGQSGYSDGPGDVARFRRPESLAVGPDGTIYVADVDNYAIRKITPGGSVTTLAVTGDATGQLSVDASGNLFLAGSTIRKVTSDGVVSVLAGVPQTFGNADGTGQEARFNNPQGIAVDAAGHVYVTDNTTVRLGQLAGPPVITVQPQTLSATAGGSVQFSVTASGAPAPTYQWYVNGSPFSGATGSTLSFANARAADAGDYTVVVTNSQGSVTSTKATLTVTAVSDPTPAPPVTTPATAAGGGGTVEGWFVLVLAALGLGRAIARRRPG